MIFFSFLWSFASSPSNISAQDLQPIEIIPNKKKYQNGDLIFFKVKILNPGFLYVLNQKTNGNLHLIFPNEDDEKNQFTGGIVRIPSKTVDYEWVIDSPEGEEIFYFILSDKQIVSFHKKKFLQDQVIPKNNWLRKHTAQLLPWEWKITETKILIKP